MSHEHEPLNTRYSERELAEVMRQRFFKIRQKYPQIPKTIDEVTPEVAEGLLDIEVKLSIRPQGDPDWMYLPQELKNRMVLARQRRDDRKKAARAAAEAHRALVMSPVTNIWTTYKAQRGSKWFATVAWSLPESVKPIVLSGVVIVAHPEATDGWMQGTPKYEDTQDPKVQNIRPSDGDAPLVRIFCQDELGDRVWSKAFNPLTGKFYDNTPPVTHEVIPVNVPDEYVEQEPEPEPEPELQKIPSRMDLIVEYIRSYKGRKTRSGKPYLRYLRRHSGIKDISAKERNEAYKIYMESKNE